MSWLRSWRACRTRVGSTTSTFDAFERKVTDGGTQYAYDSLDRVQTRGTTTLTYDGGSNNLANDGTTTYNRTPEGALLSYAAGTTGQLALTDRHTDLVGGLNADATQVTGSTSYDPFGTETATNGTTPEVGYQSGWTDPTSGDVNMAARWYQPGTGAFSSRDTWLLDPGSAAEANRQGYANGDPVNGTDPTGHVCACGGGNIYSARSAGSGNRRGVAGRGSDLAPKGYVSRGQSNRGRTTSTGGSGRRYNSSTQGQARKNNAELRRLETRYSGKTGTRTRTGSGSGGSSGRGCTYGCSNSTRYRNTGTTRGKGSPRGGTTRPPKPPTPQNPNRGKNPTPAPTRPVPKPRVDVARVQQRTVERAVVVDQRAVIEMIWDTAALFEPNSLPGPFLDEARNPGGDSRSPGECDDQAGENATGNITYFPRERFRPGPDGCRATGMVANFAGPEDMVDGTKTAWKADCESGQVTPPDFYSLPLGRNRARGHLAGCQFGGSGTDLRNLVPLHRVANSPVMSKIENRIAGEIRLRQAVHYEVTPIYTNPASGVPSLIHMEASGNRGMDVDCYVINTQEENSAICSSETYGR
ncbi:RHS repeat-associated core domain-containing protein [Streptomyces geranii]|uniref:RHS repeat-associated core domain-containing protein n=1 Tax=Streptomyces geranii TaxID=2058923 RepID=UPI000D04814F|nr:DNA/RNA non-specific endonuclease [Streptomyces geranii]